MHDLIQFGQAEPVRKRIAEATQGLLGCTILLSDDEWREPSLLPGWSRAHVAAHLARNADAFAALVRAATEDPGSVLYPSQEARIEGIERGSEQTALDLQIDLDTSAGNLSDVFDAVSDWTVKVHLPIGEMPLAAVAVARLHEVYLHHLDLRCSFSPDRIDPVPARWLLQWAVARLESRLGVHSIELASDSGLTAELGPGPDRLPVRGSDGALWGWLTGRTDGMQVYGSGGLTWPLLG